MKYLFRWQKYDEEYFLTLWDHPAILAKVWFDEHEKRAVKGWYFNYGEAFSLKDEDGNYEVYSSLEDAKRQAEMYVTELLEQHK